MDIEEENNSVVDAVYDLRRKVNTLEYLIERYDEKASDDTAKITFGVFNDLIVSIHSLLWESIIVSCYWLFEKKSQRGLIWYLEQLNSSTESLQRESLRKQIESVNVKMTGIKKIRDKWIAHRDKSVFENYAKFWAKESRLALTDLKTLSDTACKIVEIHGVRDTQHMGVHNLFVLVEHLLKNEATEGELRALVQYRY